MDFGLALPTSGRLASPSNIARMASEAELIGYSTVWTYERLLRPRTAVRTRRGGEQVLGDEYSTCFEPLETLTFVAPVTRTIRLGTSIVGALFHSPVVLARRYATLDQFSNGRVIVGLGQGWMHEEFQAVNVPLARRGQGMDEVVAAIRACWGRDPVEFSGTFYNFVASDVSPKPVQANLPIMIGAMSEAGVRRAARYADGLNLIADSLEVIRRLIELFYATAQSVGRDPSKLFVVVRANMHVTPEDQQGRDFLSGSPRQIASDVDKLLTERVDHVFFDDEHPSHDIDGQVSLFRELHAELHKVAN